MLPLRWGTLDFEDLLNEANIEKRVGEVLHSDFPLAKKENKSWKGEESVVGHLYTVLRCYSVMVIGLIKS